MLTKAKQFFKNPVYLLAVIVSLAAVGVGSAFAFSAFAGTAPDGWTSDDEYNIQRTTQKVVYLEESDHGPSVSVTFDVERDWTDKQTDYEQITCGTEERTTTYYGVRAFGAEGGNVVYRWTDADGNVAASLEHPSGGTITDFRSYLSDSYTYQSEVNATGIGSQNVWIFCTKYQNVQTAHAVYDTHYPVTYCCGRMTVDAFVGLTSNAQLNASEHPVITAQDAYAHCTETYTFEYAENTWGEQGEWFVSPYYYRFLPAEADEFSFCFSASATPPNGVVNYVSNSRRSASVPQVLLVCAPAHEYTVTVSGSRDLTQSNDEATVTAVRDNGTSVLTYEDYSSFTMKKSAAGGFYFTDTLNTSVVPFAGEPVDNSCEDDNWDSVEIPDKNETVEVYSSSDSSKLLSSSHVVCTGKRVETWTDKIDRKEYFVIIHLKDSSGTEFSTIRNGYDSNNPIYPYDGEIVYLRSSYLNIYPDSSVDLRTVDGLHGTSGLSTKLAVKVKYDYSPLDEYAYKKFAANDGYETTDHYVMENPVADSDGFAELLSNYGDDGIFGGQNCGSAYQSDAGLFERTVKLAGKSEENHAPEYSADGESYVMIDGWQMSDPLDGNIKIWPIENKEMLTLTVEDLVSAINQESDVYDNAYGKFQFDAEIGFFVCELTVQPVIGNTVSYVAEYSDGVPFELNGYSAAFFKPGETAETYGPLTSFESDRYPYPYYQEFTFSGWKLDESAMEVDAATLAAWKNDPGKVTFDSDGNIADTFIMPDFNVVLKGVLSPITYTLHYDKNLDAATDPKDKDGNVSLTQTFTLYDCELVWKSETYYWNTITYVDKVLYAFPKRTTSAEGRRFLGWSESGEKPVVTKAEIPLCTVYSPSSIFRRYDEGKPVCDFYVKGVWDDPAYTLTYDAGGKTLTGGDLPDDQVFNTDVVTGGNAKPAPGGVVPKADGFTFSGWKITGADGGEITFDKTNSGNVTVGAAAFDTNLMVKAVAQWTENTYTLTYDKNLASASAPTLTSKTFQLSDCVKDGTTYTYTFPSSSTSADGYTFEGWSESGSAPVVTGITVDPDTVSYTVKGVWTKKNYTLVYHKNLEAASNPDPASVTFTIDDVSGGQYAFASQTLSAVGYDFKGWGESASATSPVTSVAFSADTQTYDVYGIWTEKNYTLTYDKNLTSASTPSVTSKTFKLSDCVKDGTTYTYTFPSSSTSADGYIFEGWSESGSTPAVTSIAVNPDTASYTVKGIWTKKNYTLVYHKNLGAASNPDPASVTFTIDDVSGGKYAFASQTLSAVGYEFKGWGESASATSPVTSVAFSADTQTYDVYGIWNKVSYQVTYNPNKAKIDNQDPSHQPTVNPETFDIDSAKLNGTKDAYSLYDTELTVSGYMFKGWNTNPEATSGSYTLAFDPAVKEYTVYAIWDIWTYRVVYQKGTGHDSATNMPQGRNIDGTVDAASSVEKYLYGDVHLAPYPTVSTQKPIDDGFTFTGWRVQTAGGTKGYTVEAIDSGVSMTITDADFPLDTLTIYVTALWEAVSIPDPTYSLTYVTAAPEGTPANVPADVDDIPYADVKDGNYRLSDKTPTLDGFDFKGWKLNSTGTTVQPDAAIPFACFDNAERTAVATAVWEKAAAVEPTYTLIYDCNTSTYPEITGLINQPANELLQAKDFTGGKHTLTADVPDSDNFRFVCWCRTKAYSYDNRVEEVRVGDFDSEGKLTVYAIWVAKLDVKYQCGIDESDPAWQYNQRETNHVFEIDHYTLNYRVLDNDHLEHPFVYPGHRITKWKVVSGWENIEFPSGQSSGGSVYRAAAPTYPRSGGSDDHYLDFNTMVILHGDVVVQAVWEEIKVNLTYHANGGSPASAVPNNGSAIEFTIDDAVTVEDGSGLTKGDLSFDYWSTTADDVSGSKHYKKGDTFTITANTDLYAIYKTAPSSDGGKEYTVTYNANGGTGTVPTDNNKYTGGETVTVKDKGALARTDCTFREWNTKKDGSGTAYKGDGTATFTMPESNVTLYAIWVDSNGKIIPSPGTGESDMPVILALNMALLAVLAAGFVLMKQYNRRRETAN